MENTVTISLKEYDALRDGFDNSKSKKMMQNEITKLEIKTVGLLDTIEKIKDKDFVFLYSNRHWLNKEYYIRKDKTPIWIKRIFNYL
jgi:hypothetical protein